MTRISKELKLFKEILDIDECINENEIENYDLHLLIRNIEDEAIYIDEQRNLNYVVHSLESILVTVILALLANCNTFVEIHLFAETHYEWLKKHINFDAELPSISTFKRVISVINPKELEFVCNNVFFNFAKSMNDDLIYNKDNLKVRDINVLDGKTANSSDRITRDGIISKTNAMSLYSIKYEKCLATEFIDEKTNEIPTGPILLSRLSIENVICTFDALNTQKTTINYIMNNNGYYVAPVKENHDTLYQDIADYFKDDKLLEEDTKKYIVKENEKSHNQVEKRKCIFTNNIDWLYDKEEWKGIKSIGVIIKETENSKEPEFRYFISNIDAKHIELLNKVIRNEWNIENKLHWYLDMTFQEDKNKCYLENSQKNLNIIRKFCLGILKIVKLQYNLSLNSIRFKLSMNFEKEIEQLLKLL